MPATSCQMQQVDDSTEPTTLSFLPDQHGQIVDPVSACLADHQVISQHGQRPYLDRILAAEPSGG